MSMDRIEGWEPGRGTLPWPGPHGVPGRAPRGSAFSAVKAVCGRWKDVRVVYAEHAPAAFEMRASAPPQALSIALLPVERAAWRVDGGPTREGRILAGTTTVRGSHEVVWLRWDQPFKCIQVSLRPALLARVANQAGSRYKELEYREGVHDPTVLHCALLLAREARNGGSAGALYVESIAHLMAVHTLRTYAGAGRNAERPVRALDTLRVQQAKDYIEANLSAPLSLETIARAAGTSPFHFARGFKATTGLPPHRYVTQRRVERAKLLLAQTELPVSDVASLLGLENQSHFTAQFRKLVGCTPGRFRHGHR